MDTSAEVTRISNDMKLSRHLVPFAQAMGGPGVFLLLKKGFSERYVDVPGKCLF